MIQLLSTDADDGPILLPILTDANDGSKRPGFVVVAVIVLLVAIGKCKCTETIVENELPLEVVDQSDGSNVVLVDGQNAVAVGSILGVAQQFEGFIGEEIMTVGETDELKGRRDLVGVDMQSHFIVLDFFRIGVRLRHQGEQNRSFVERGQTRGQT